LRPGFTLVELLVVIVIIGIIIAFILIAAQDARRRAEEEATHSLIVKLEGGINDRLDALLQTRPDPNWAHFYVSAIYTNDPATGTPIILPNPGPLPPALSVSPPPSARAQVIAWYDFIKSEMPDVFFVQNSDIGDPQRNPYPLNFAANLYPGTSISTDPYGLGNWMLPLGNGVDNNPANNSYGANNRFQPMGTGIYGASYFAAAGIYKNLGYSPQGYDGVDNNANGAIDELAEGVAGLTQQQLVTLQGNLRAHKQHTARAEMLYAMLVEGVGPLGSVFSRDDFTDAQVKDTDNDGLPEFVDAWGQPLQFFRWPLLYGTDTQKGQVIVRSPTGPEYEDLLPPYTTVFDARETAPLDPNNQLLAPAWWSGLSVPPGANINSPFAGLFGTPGTVGGSGGVVAFEYFFHRLTEPFPPNNNNFQYWDRGTIFPYRRAFFSKPLILSSGPNLQPGVFLYPEGTLQSLANPALALIANENLALPFSVGTRPQMDLGDFTLQETIQAGVIPAVSSGTPTYPSTYDLREAGKDDITNQNRTAQGGSGGS
jgi:prepilin-type N-terminal cleavage/methylation domain-containing protein